MNKRTRSAAWGFGTLEIGAALSRLGTCPLLLRRRCLTWGARPDEVSRKLPGDELLPPPRLVATRAIRINTLPAAIWPWLVEIGSGRGGVYTYDWIENLFGLNMHSAAGSCRTTRTSRSGTSSRWVPAARPAVHRLRPRTGVHAGCADGNWVWSCAMFAEGGNTRLIGRNRIPAARTSPAACSASLSWSPAA